MFTVITVILTAAAAVFFTADCLGRINRKAEGTGIIYSGTPLLLGIVLCVCAAFSDNFDFSGFFEGRADIDFAKPLLISCGICIPAFIISLIGGVRLAVQNGKDTGYESFGPGGEVSLLTLWQTFSAGAGTLSGAVFVILAAVAAVRAAGTFSAGAFAAVIAFGALTVLTFGIGIIFAVLVMPAVLAMIGINAIVSVLPLIAASLICGAVFCTEHIMTVVCSAAALKRLHREGSLSKKKAVIYGLLSALPGVNVFISAQLRAKTLHNEAFSR